MKTVRKIDNHDTRGRKIVSVNYAKKALIIIYAIVFCIGICLRECFVESYMIAIENYLSNGIRFGLITGILFFVSWIVTFKVGMNKFAIRDTEKTTIKAIFILINICVCGFFIFAMLFKSFGVISTLKHQYKSIINTYSSYIDDETEKELKEILEETLKPIKDVLYTMVWTEIGLGICGNFLGCAFVKRDIENLGIDDEEYMVCKNIEYKSSDFVEG